MRLSLLPCTSLLNWLKLAAFQQAYHHTVETFLKMIVTVIGGMWRLPRCSPCVAGSFCSLSPAGCQGAAPKSDSSALAPQSPTSSAASAPRLLSFSFPVCQMRIIQVTTARVAVRSEHDHVWGALSLGLTQSCQGLLKRCLLSVTALSYGCSPLPA